MSDEEIKVFVARMDERWERVEEDLKKLKHVLLEGNGSPAVIVTVATMDQRIKQLEEDRTDKKVPRHVALGIWVSIILGMAGILAGFANH